MSGRDDALRALRDMRAESANSVYTVEVTVEAFDRWIASFAAALAPTPDAAPASEAREAITESLIPERRDPSLPKGRPRGPREYAADGWNACREEVARRVAVVTTSGRPYAPCYLCGVDPCIGHPVQAQESGEQDANPVSSSAPCSSTGDVDAARQPVTSAAPKPAAETGSTGAYALDDIAAACCYEGISDSDYQRIEAYLTASPAQDAAHGGRHD